MLIKVNNVIIIYIETDDGCSGNTGIMAEAPQAQLVAQGPQPGGAGGFNTSDQSGTSAMQVT